MFVVEGGVARLRPVTLGVFSDARQEIRGGLRIGEQIIITGVDQLNDGDPVVASGR